MLVQSIRFASQPTPKTTVPRLTRKGGGALGVDELKQILRNHVVKASQNPGDERTSRVVCASVTQLRETGVPMLEIREIVHSDTLTTLRRKITLNRPAADNNDGRTRTPGQVSTAQSIIQESERMIQKLLNPEPPVK